MRKRKLGEALLERGSVTSEGLEWALNEQRSKAVMLGDLLLSRDLVSRKDLATTLEETLEIRYVNAKAADRDPQALKLVPYAVATRNCALPLYRHGKELIVVMANPTNLRSLDE